MTTRPDSSQHPVYPGHDLGLPEHGAGSLAPWGSRLMALLIDWGLALGVAVLAFGPGVLSEPGWRAWTPLVLFAVLKGGLTALTGSSVGHRLAGIGVMRVDGRPLGWPEAIGRTVAQCLVLPILIVGPARRMIADVLLGTVVVRRR